MCTFHQCSKWLCDRKLVSVESLLWLVLSAVSTLVTGSWRFAAHWIGDFVYVSGMALATGVLFNANRVYRQLALCRSLDW